MSVPSETTSAATSEILIVTAGKAHQSGEGTGLSFEDLRAGPTGRIQIDIASVAPLYSVGPNEGCGGGTDGNSSC